MLRIDLNTERYAGPEKLDAVIDTLLRGWEEKYEVDVRDTEPSQRFKRVIEVAHEKTGHPVVILVDEYDKPLVTNLNNAEAFEIYRAKLAALYSNFKSGAAHIRLVFLTGVSRFSKLSVFSDLNNLKDITFNNEFADICGITEKELEDNFRPGIADLAKTLDIDYGSAMQELKNNYDGYRFTEKGSDIYNPDPTALMYQTGYLTIKDYDRETNEYHLGIPNREVRKGLMNYLLPYYVRTREGMPKKVLGTINRSLLTGDPRKAMEALRIYFAGIDYGLRMDSENNFHNAFFLLLDLIGLNAQAESHTSDGRIDILVQTPKYVYVIELKYDHTAEDALRQIEEKKYALRFRADGRRVFKIGASLSSATRRIEDWLIAED